MVQGPRGDVCQKLLFLIEHPSRLGMHAGKQAGTCPNPGRQFSSTSPASCTQAGTFPTPPASRQQPGFPASGWQRVPGLPRTYVRGWEGAGRRLGRFRDANTTGSGVWTVSLDLPALYTPGDGAHFHVQVEGSSKTEVRQDLDTLLRSE